ncbi:hypothetical protein Btru_075251 [Bulinus truncatus]|nr:hypothetical protein Btru_075251 [Bulinus truncatus]
MQSTFVHIYKGHGANENGCFHLLNALKATLDTQKHTINFISSEDIIEGSKLENTALLTFGSGFTTGFADALGIKGMMNLRDYVLNGGSYLGLGAGGYFGCDYVEFDKNGPLEKLVERELRFYPGIGRGPVYPGFQYGTNKGLHAAPISFNTVHFTATFSSMIDGGGAFYPKDSAKPGSLVTDINNVAFFTDLSGQPAAVVKTTVGSGHAVLSGVHLEYDMSQEIKSDPSLDYLLETFAANRLKQMSAFKSLLKLLGLRIV